MRVLAACLVLWGALAHAQPIRPALARATNQVEQGDYEDAVRTVEAGIAEPDLTDAELAEYYRLLGLAHLYLGHEEQARRAFERLLQARPDYELPRAAPPKTKALYARIKDDIRQRRVRPVTLTLTPVGSQPGGQPIVVEAEVSNLALGSKPRLFYRRAGAQAFSSSEFSRRAGQTSETSERFEATIPGFEVPTEQRAYEVEYYVEVSDAAQRRLAGRGDSFSPLSFSVAPSSSEGGHERDHATSAAPVPLYKSPWLWLGVGVLVAGATTGIVLAATNQPKATLPITIQIEGQP